MATLVTRPGDCQALKAAAAAQLAGADLAVLPLADGAWKKLLADSGDAATARQLFLVLPDGSTLGEPNAIARYLGAQRGGRGLLACQHGRAGSSHAAMHGAAAAAAAFAAAAHACHVRAPVQAAARRPC